MYLVVVDIHVKIAHCAEFVAASRRNSEATRQEPGNLRFDVAVAEEDPQRFLFYEAYRTKEDFAKHQQTGHYHAWRAAVADWMEKPRSGVKYHSLAPSSEADW
jgi:autoinducer 2-degrading protein